MACQAYSRMPWTGHPGRLGNRPCNESQRQLWGATPGRLGTARAQTQLRQSLAYTNTYTVLQPEVLVDRAHEKFDREGRLTDEPARELVGTLLLELETLTRALSQGTDSHIHATMP